MAESPEAPLERIAAMRPRLATADRLLPYLRRIDESRLYSNFGPLALEFEDRLCRHWALPEGAVVSASSGLAALVGAILGTAGRANPARPIALVPDYTFIATASAVELCGYLPALVDVRADDWQIDPAALLAHPELDRVGLVVPVSPYGRHVAAAPWLAFRERTGIPVVIDGAACFDTLRADAGATPFPLPVALSFHATKSLGTGEGGGVVCSDLDALERIGRALNFGFESVRDCRSANTNGKMSEYTAAVGLAELDGWDAKHAAFLEVASHYRAQAQARGIAASLHLAPDIACNYALFLADDADAARRTCARLLAAGIEYRHWYGLGLHRQSYCAGFAAQPRPVTDDLAPRLIGLPMAPDLPPSAVARVLDAIAGGRTGARHMNEAGVDPAAGAATTRALAELDGASLATFGYIDDYAPYRVAHPWLLAQLAALPAGARVLDLGAGVSALPLVLAARGMHVDCVDNSPIDRILPATGDWNGWGFFDYATVHPRLRAFRADAATFTGDAPYDAVVSVGVVAHLSAAVRRACVARCRDWLAPGGQLLVHVDLHRGGNDLWNRSQDREVEPLATHGSIADFAGELRAAGLVDVGLEVFRGLPGTRTDGLLARAVAPLRAC